MTTNSVSTRDISRLSEILDLNRVDRATTAVDAMSRALELTRALVGCDAAQFQAFDSLDFSVSYLQYVDDNEVTVLSSEELARLDDEPGVHVLKERWWTSCCSLIERTGRPVVATVRTGRSDREWARDPVNREYLKVVDEAVIGFLISTFRSLRILLPRMTGSSFGEREITLLKVLLPHMQPLMTAAFEEGSLARPTPTPPLTVRQREILGLVRLGCPTSASAGFWGSRRGPSASTWRTSSNGWVCRAERPPLRWPPDRTTRQAEPGDPFTGAPGSCA